LRLSGIERLQPDITTPPITSYPHTIDAVRAKGVPIRAVWHRAPRHYNTAKITGYRITRDHRSITRIIMVYPPTAVASYTITLYYRRRILNINTIAVARNRVSAIYRTAIIIIYTVTAVACNSVSLYQRGRIVGIYTV